MLDKFLFWKSWLVECCFMSTETVGLLGTGARDGHLDIHTASELCWKSQLMQTNKQPWQTQPEKWGPVWHRLTSSATITDISHSHGRQNVTSTQPCLILTALWEGLIIVGSLKIRSPFILFQCCFTSTETVGLLGTGAQDGHLDFHTVPALSIKVHWFSVSVLLYVHRNHEAY